MLRVGRIDYANCTPLFMQFEEQLPEIGVGLVHGVPAELNRLLAIGEVDLCISSSIEFCRQPDRYRILPGHCIGSDGPVQSVLLCSTRPVEELAGEPLLLTSESATSVVLLQILLARYWKVTVGPLAATSLTWQEALSQAPGLLLIGDKALQAAASGMLPFCYDLGVAWKRLTGLPFVFALWLLNKQSATGKEPAVTCFSQLLAAARDRIADHAPMLAGRAPESAWLPQGILADYWRNAITYRLDDRHIAGLQQFYRFAAELGLIEQIPPLEFYPI